MSTIKNSSQNHLRLWISTIISWKKEKKKRKKKTNRKLQVGRAAIRLPTISVFRFSHGTGTGVIVIAYGPLAPYPTDQNRPYRSFFFLYTIISSLYNYQQRCNSYISHKTVKLCVLTLDKDCLVIFFLLNIKLDSSMNRCVPCRYIQSL